MRIQDLLEATLYRYQPEWKAEDLPPVIHMKGRAERESSSSSFDIYGVAAALEFAGIDCPRRWRSTFVTTNPDDSMFMKYMDDKSGMRQVIIPPNVKLGGVANDFNANKTFVPALYRVGMSTRTIVESLKYKQQTPDVTNLLQTIYDWTDRWDELYFGKIRNDQSYDEFKKCVVEFDQIVMNDLVDAASVDPAIIGEGSLKNALVVEIQRALDDGRLFVFNSVDDVPETEKGLELWFEGDYEAREIAPQ